MPTIQQTIADDITRAQKEKNVSVLDFLRFISAQIKNLEIELQKKLGDEDIIGVIKNQKKQLLQSIELFKKGGRDELAEQYRKQIDILDVYLPQAMDKGQLKVFIQQILNEHAEKTTKKGELIGICVSRLRGKADSADIVSIVEELVCD